MARIPFEIEPGSGCPGGVLVSGKPAGLCITCSRLGGQELEPVLTISRGFVECCNFHPLSVAGAADGVHPAGVGAPVRGGLCGSARTGGCA